MLIDLLRPIAVVQLFAGFEPANEAEEHCVVAEVSARAVLVQDVSELLPLNVFHLSAELSLLRHLGVGGEDRERDGVLVGQFSSGRVCQGEGLAFAPNLSDRWCVEHHDPRHLFHFLDGEVGAQTRFLPEFTDCAETRSVEIHRALRILEPSEIDLLLPGFFGREVDRGEDFAVQGGRSSIEGDQPNIREPEGIPPVPDLVELASFLGL